MNEWMPDITDDDIAVLVEALESWESKDAFSDAMGELFSAVICKDDPVAKAKMEDSRRTEKIARERAKTLRKERSIILRAKLLTLRERRRVEDVTRSVGVGQVR